jgi:hypothetical protein
MGDVTVPETPDPGLAARVEALELAVLALGKRQTITPTETPSEVEEST